jgi:hypothetical protein
LDDAEKKAKALIIAIAKASNTILGDQFRLELSYTLESLAAKPLIR